MNRREFKNRYDEKVIVEDFSSIHELISTIESREVSKAFEYYEGFSSCARFKVESGEKPWTGAKDWKEATSKIKQGDDSLYKKFKKVHQEMSLKNIKSVSKKSYRSINDLVGYTPNVPNSIMNLPNSMINSVVVRRKNKVIDLLVDVTHPAYKSTSEILEYGCQVVQAIEQLEKAGYRVRVNAFLSFGDAGTPWHVLKFRIKNEGQPLDLKKLVYPVAGAATLRRIGFAWYESLPGGKYVSEYGLAVYQWDFERAKKEILKFAGLGAEQIYLNSYDSVSKQIENSGLIK